MGPHRASAEPCWINSQHKFDDVLHEFSTRDAATFVARKGRVHPLMHGGKNFLAGTGKICAFLPYSTNVHTAEDFR
jgi:hypothetical protein